MPENESGRTTLERIVLAWYPVPDNQRSLNFVAA